MTKNVTYSGAKTMENKVFLPQAVPRHVGALRKASRHPECPCPKLAKKTGSRFRRTEQTVNVREAPRSLRLPRAATLADTVFFLMGGRLLNCPCGIMAGENTNGITSLYSTISYHDNAESFYHGFMTGLLRGAGLVISSNRENGLGRTDIAILLTAGTNAPSSLN